MMQTIGTVILLAVLVGGIFLYLRTCSLEREIQETMAAEAGKGAAAGGNGVQTGGRTDG